MNQYLIEIGKIIKQKREAEEIPVEYISKKTQLSKKYILAIEDGTIDKMFSAAYVSGYIRIYCKIINVDCSSLIKKYVESSPVKSISHLGNIWQENLFIYEEEILPKFHFICLSVIGMIALYIACSILFDTKKEDILADKINSSMYNSDKILEELKGYNKFEDNYSKMDK